MRRSLISFLFIYVLLINCAGSLVAQECSKDMTIYGAITAASGDVSFGREIYVAGDVNNDGYSDILALAIGGQFSSNAMAIVYSGLTGDSIRTYYNNNSHIRGAGGFGYFDDDDYADVLVNGVIYSGLSGDTLADYSDVAQYGISGGDLNADGKHDIVVPNINWSTTDGRVDVISGANGDTLHSWTGRSGYAGTFGWSIAVAGDVDADGTNDIIIGEPRYDSGTLPSGKDKGQVYVYSGRTGYKLYSRVGPSAYGQFGYNVEGAGDLDNDGFDDILISGQNETSMSPLKVWAYSVKLKSLIHSVSGSLYKDEYGAAMDGIGDINQDGYDDFAVSAYRYDYSASHTRNRGNLYIYSGIDGSLIQETYKVNISPLELLGTAIRGLGDIDSDGNPDFAAGAIWARAPGDPANEYRGAVYVYRCPMPTNISEEISIEIPENFALKQNHPNPFNPETVFEYGITKQSQVTIEVFNVTGQKIRTLVNEIVSAGSYQVVWDGRNEFLEQVASGIYFYRINTGDYTDTKKMVLLR
ncbi:MAG: T9SS type A sorting domain-containing protein [candidate division Zixibacteria bacterium]|nr:T9SS type A sorting domain-containing protein [candidate division Zixibacteria bacterium]